MVDENVYHQGPPRPTSGSNTWLWVFSIAGLFLVVCCGAVVAIAWKVGDAAKTFVANMATSDPAEIRRQTAEMVDIEIPDKYQPMQGMNLVAFRMVMYQTDPAQDPSGGMLMLMEMAMQPGVNDQQEQELRNSMQQQHGKQFKSRKSETREIEIRGEKIPFEFSEGTTAEPEGQEKKFHMISGVFRGKQGRSVMLQLVIPDEEYDEAAVMEMLQSIK